jgi:hypothetical protein
MASKVPAIVISVILSGALVGGGVYYYSKTEIDQLTQTKDSLQQEINQLKKGTPTSAEKPVNHVAVRAEEVLSAFKNGDYSKLSTYVHPDKGVRFSPYTHVEPEHDKTFTSSQIKGMSGNTTVYEWGSYDGSGEPIKLNFTDYVKKFVYNQDFLTVKQISFNYPIGKGNTINNVAEKYPDATIIEYHFPGTSQYDGMDWNSLKLAFEKKDGVWYLVGVIHDQWTI